MVGEVFTTMVSNLNQLGFYGFVLPWLLVFGVTYGILEKSKLLNKKAAGIVSLAVAFFVTAYTGIGSFFIGLSGVGAMVITAALIVVMFFALVTPPTPKEEKETIYAQRFGKIEWVLFFGAVALILAWLVGGETLTGISLSNEAWAAILVIVVIGFAVWLISGGGKKGEKTSSGGGGQSPEE